MTVFDIARRLGLARQSVQRVADVLVSDGQWAVLRRACTALASVRDALDDAGAP